MTALDDLRDLLDQQEAALIGSVQQLSSLFYEWARTLSPRYLDVCAMQRNAARESLRAREMYQALYQHKEKNQS